MSTAARIVELEAELRRLRNLGRVKREPRPGFGGTVQRLREAKGLGPRQLGEKSGCGSALVTVLETADRANPRLDTIEKLAAGLGLKTSELIIAYEQNL